MERSHVVYPIHTGDELNIFASDRMNAVKIMDTQGNVVLNMALNKTDRDIINIKNLPEATYIIEVLFDNTKTGRSVFIKM